jgi:uncharacterized phage-like protein YoqJ
MQNKICSFCGHREVFDSKIQEQVENTIIDLIENHEVGIFYSGGMGEFDKICETAVRKLKRKYMHIKLYWIAPYFTRKINTAKNMYDKIIIADLANVHYKKAITKRNQLMAEKSDFIICYVIRGWGGAYTMMKYAKNTKASLIHIGL